ncbi:unnamed protein product [Allacma fusca]|uniref:PiggyBac transposable element-derived protein domain-containing protein n=1 Tax=Allacma fusca TaxID=39272 RepID=A0A8J2KIL3_9HEXA|nr:unnamed protein product [Allacma fusca]
MASTSRASGIGTGYTWNEGSSSEDSDIDTDVVTEIEDNVEDTDDEEDDSVVTAYTARNNKTGVRVSVPRVNAAQTKMDIFKLFVTDEMLYNIDAYTKNQAAKRGQRNFTDDAEIMAFIGLMYMAAAYGMRRPSTKRLWREDKRYQLHAFSATMSRERFRNLMRFLRFDDIETREERRAVDKLAPIRELTENLRKNVHEVYEPDK